MHGKYLHNLTILNHKRSLLIRVHVCNVYIFVIIHAHLNYCIEEGIHEGLP